MIKKFAEACLGMIVDEYSVIFSVAGCPFIFAESIVTSSEP